eukprot:1492725-Rhodomonas_salina.1
MHSDAHAACQGMEFAGLDEELSAPNLLEAILIMLGIDPLLGLSAIFNQNRRRSMHHLPHPFQPFGTHTLVHQDGTLHPNQFLMMEPGTADFFNDYTFTGMQGGQDAFAQPPH